MRCEIGLPVRLRRDRMNDMTNHCQAVIELCGSLRSPTTVFPVEVTQKKTRPVCISLKIEARRVRSHYFYPSLSYNAINFFV